jgi:peptidoglycan/xylan/chitin deacetylase (PgdA/CDA1 family)
VRRGLKRLFRRPGSGVAVLMYHRVRETDVDPWRTCVSPSRFHEQVAYLSRRYTVMSLASLADALAHGNLPRRALVLTFDDGYTDNLHTAKPILEQLGAPATFFVTTGALDGAREFWWDELARVFLEPGRLPRTFTVDVGDGLDGWNLGDQADYGPDACRRHRDWNVYRRENPTPRHALLRALYQHLYRLPSATKRSVLDRVFAWAGLAPEPRPSHRALSPDELLEVERGGLVDVGAHSVTHPVLTALGRDEQREEMARSKAVLESVLGHAVTSFAYPHGAHDDATVELAREAGFTTAVTVKGFKVDRRTDPLRVPRMDVGNWGAKELGARLADLLASPAG